MQSLSLRLKGQTYLSESATIGGYITFISVRPCLFKMACGDPGPPHCGERGPTIAPFG